MAYKERLVIFADHIEVKRYYAPNQSAKTRAAKKSTAKKAVAEVNKANAVEKLSWLIAENFSPGDWHFSPTFAPGNMPADEQAAKMIFQKFLTVVRRLYKKHDVECKYIWTTGVSSRGRIHLHLILNHVQGIEMHDLQRAWRYGQLRLNNLLYADGWYKDLAAYLIDQDRTPQAERKGQRKYSCSKNLKMPEIRKRIIKRKFWRQAEPGPPEDYRTRWKIDPETVENLIRDFDGTPMQKFTLIKKKE